MEQRRLNVVELRNALAEVLNRVEYRGDRVIIHRRNKDAAALISIEDLRLLERLVEEEEDRIDIAAAEAACREPGEPIAFEDLCKELGVRSHESGRTRAPVPNPRAPERRPRAAKTPKR